MCALSATVSAAEKPSAAQRSWLVRVDPVEIGSRDRDERPAEFELDVGQDRLDVASLRIVRVEGDSTSDPLPLRWYDASIPDPFPEFQDSASRTEGRLEPKPRARGGYYLNPLGDGHRGRVVWLHTQVGQTAARYRIEADLLPPGAVPQHTAPQGWIGDGQPRCAPVATQTVQSDHLHLDLDDWDGDGLIDLVVGDDFGHVTHWPNLGTAQSPRYEYCRLIADADGAPLDVGIIAAPKVCDWDNDGDRDLVIGTERNRIVWYENTGTDAARSLTYRGLVLLDDKPLELPVTPLFRGEPEIFKLDYYPVQEFVDWDGDGDRDLLAGGYITGCVFLYETVAHERGTGPQLVARGPLQADGDILNVGHWCASPTVADLDADGDLDLLSGQTPMRERGAKAGIRLFTNIGSPTAPQLTAGNLPTEQLWSITLGAPRLADLDADGDLDLVIAARPMIYLLMNEGTVSTPKFSGRPISILPKWGPDPVYAEQLLDWNGDGHLDLAYGVRVRLNDGTFNPWSWSETVSALQPGAVIEHKSGRGDEEHSMVLDDFNGDGVMDVLFGDWFGHVWLHRNNGTRETPDVDLAGIRLPTRSGSPIKVGPIGGDPDKDFTALQGARTVVTAGDFDADGRRDLVVGDTFGKVRYYRQLPDADRISPAVPTFAEAIEIGDLGIRLNVCATDWNQDGRMDVIAGSANGRVNVFLTTESANDRSPFAPGFTPELPPIMQPRVILGDLNGDGDDDLFFPSTQGACFVERSFLSGGYAQAIKE